MEIFWFNSNIKLKIFNYYIAHFIKPYRDPVTLQT